MQHYKTFFVMLSCLCLLVGNVANAATDCCLKTLSEQSQMTEGQTQAMPCHQSSSASAKTFHKNMGSDHCNCQHLVKYSIDIHSPMAISHSVPLAVSAPIVVYHSHEPDGWLQPPKALS